MAVSEATDREELDHIERSAWQTPMTSSILHRFGIWVALFLVLNGAYLYILFGSPGQVTSCCDARAYMIGANHVVESGLLADTHLIGYRSIWNYALIRGIAGIGTAIGVPPTDRVPAVIATADYAVGAMIAYGAVAALFIGFFSRLAGFGAAFSAVFLNPIVFAHVPVPLQESQMAIIVLPLIVAAYLALKNEKSGTALVLIAALAAAAWMVKSALITIALPATLVWAMVLFNSRRLPHAWIASAASVLIACLIIAPQVYVAYWKLGTLYPYPNGSVFVDQLAWGHEYWKWETVMPPEGNPKGRAWLSPFGPIAPAEYVGSMLANPLKAVELFGGHLLTAFDYTNLKVYIDNLALPPMSPNNVIVGMIIFLGLQRTLSLVGPGRYRLHDAVIDASLFGGIVMLPLLAVETRFSLIPMTMLTVRFLEAVTARTRDISQSIGMALIFGLVFATAIGFLYNSAKLI